MQIEVGPARRPGHSHEIYNQPLTKGDLTINSDGGITLTVETTGIKAPNSRYRYRLHLSPSDTERLKDCHVTSAT